MQRQTILSMFPATALAAAGLPAMTMPAMAADEPAMDHSKMGHDMVRDEKGRTLYGMKHQTDPALNNELRQNVRAWKNYSDAMIAMSMDNMGMEYAWYTSPPELKGSQGVLILTHGFREPGDSIFKERVSPISNIFPTSLGIGMAMMMSQHIQIALDDLKAAGVKEVVVLPVTSTEKNELYRQWLYILGRLDKAEYASVPQVKTDLKLKIVPPPGDSGLVAEILIDHAREMSTDPKSEVVIIAGHGPSDDADNAAVMKEMANLAKMVKEDGGFAAVYGQTLQDDAPPEIRAANVKKLRGLVENAAKDGKRVLIVTNLIGARTIQAKLRDDLKGLDYKFSPKGIVEHDNMITWMMDGIRIQLTQSAGL
jgi:hypothetical protein